MSDQKKEKDSISTWEEYFNIRQVAYIKLRDQKERDINIEAEKSKTNYSKKDLKKILLKTATRRNDQLEKKMRELINTFFEQKWKYFWKIDLICSIVIIFGLVLSDIEVTRYVDYNLATYQQT